MSTTKQIEFMQLYAKCEQQFVKYCSALTCNKTEAEDLIQDVLLATYEQFEQIRQKDRLVRYMIRIAHNYYAGQWRKTKYKFISLEDHAQLPYLQTCTPEISLDTQLLYRKLNQLPEKQREALILFEICGFNLREISDIQNSVINTVKSHLNRGRKKLRQLMAEKRRAYGLIGILFGKIQITIPGFGLDKLRKLLYGLKPSIMYSLGSLVVVASISSQHKFSAATQINASIGQVLVNTSLVPDFKIRRVDETLNLVEASPPEQIPDNHRVVQKQVRLLSRIELPSLLDTHQVIEQHIPLSSYIVSKTLPSFYRPVRTNIVAQPQKVGDLNRCDTLILKGRLQDLKEALEKELETDRLPESRKSLRTFCFNKNKVTLNGKVLPMLLQDRYLNLLDSYGIKPCVQLWIFLDKKELSLSYMGRNGYYYFYSSDDTGYKIPLKSNGPPSYYIKLKKLPKHR